MTSKKKTLITWLETFLLSSTSSQNSISRPTLAQARKVQLLPTSHKNAMKPSTPQLISRRLWRKADEADSKEKRTGKKKRTNPWRWYALTKDMIRKVFQRHLWKKGRKGSMQHHQNKTESFAVHHRHSRNLLLSPRKRKHALIWRIRKHRLDGCLSMATPLIL